jgi:hypothetical protein
MSTFEHFELAFGSTSSKQPTELRSDRTQGTSVRRASGLVLVVHSEVITRLLIPVHQEESGAPLPRRHTRRTR